MNKLVLWIHSHYDTIWYSFYGAITAAGVGMLILQALGAFVLAIIGALGGWFANEMIIPHLKKYFKK